MYEAPVYHGSSRCVLPSEQVISIDYPMMLYKGYTPDDRELIMVNLADREQPQKIINLYEMQFICFVGHNFVDRESKIGMLTLDSDHAGVRLSWLRTHQPYEKKLIDDLVDFSIEEIPIAFDLPIRRELDTIKKCEYVNL